MIVCSSGIATTVHDDLGTYVRTVHSHYGLQTADLPSDLVVDHALANSLVRERVKVASSIIWYELSMSSKTIFEMVNRIHHLLAPEKDFWKPFGGKQLVLVGELRPKPTQCTDLNWIEWVLAIQTLIVRSISNPYNSYSTLWSPVINRARSVCMRES